MKDLTICIPTHCVRVEKGHFACPDGTQTSIPSAPNTNMIEHVIEDFFNKTGVSKDTKIIIGVDNRLGRDIDELYLTNLESIKSKYNCIVLRNDSVSYHPIDTAHLNFMRIYDAVETDYFFTLEHDWIFTQNIDLSKIIDIMKCNDFNQLRFPKYKVGSLPDSVEKIYKTINLSDMNFSYTNLYSNNPNIVKTETYKKWWKNLIYSTHEIGGFVEGPMNVFYRFAIEKMGAELASNNFKIFVYGGIGEGPFVDHLNGAAWNKQ
jgi:hypothetical protein